MQKVDFAIVCISSICINFTWLIMSVDFFRICANGFVYVQWCISHDNHRKTVQLGRAWGMGRGRPGAWWTAVGGSQRLGLGQSRLSYLRTYLLHALLCWQSPFPAPRAHGGGREGGVMYLHRNKITVDYRNIC